MRVYIVTRPVDLGVEIVGVFLEESSANKCCDKGNEENATFWVGTDGNEYHALGGWSVECWDVA